MSKSVSQTILAFYSSNSEEAHRSNRLLRKAGARTCLLGAPNVAVPEWCVQFEELRLTDEILLVAQCRSSEASGVLEIVQDVGAPAIFVIEGPGPSPAPPERPYTSLSVDDLRAHMRDTAAGHGAPSGPVNGQGLQERLLKSESALRSAAEELAEFGHLDHSLTAAADWLLDNDYLVRTSVAEILQHLPAEHRRLLPALASAGGTPRIYEFAKELAGHTDNALTEENITNSVRDYQTVQAFTIAEIWLLPLMLRLVLVESLGRLAKQVSHAQYLREAGYLWANRLVSAFRQGQPVFDRMLTRLDRDPIASQNGFVACLDEQLQGQEHILGPVLKWLDSRLMLPRTEIVRHDHEAESRIRLSVASAFGSLRMLGQLDAAKLFENTSLVEAELRMDPAGIYPCSAFETRNRCRSTVEDLARTSNADELDVARLAVRLATEGLDSRAQEVTYYLFAEGIRTMELQLRAAIPLRKRLARALRARPATFYITAIVSLTICFLALSVEFAWELGFHDPLRIAALALLAMFPLSEFATQFVNALVISLMHPDELPRMDYRHGIPACNQTLVVVPMMLTSAPVIHRELEKLEVRFLGNRSPNISFSLFSDFLDATSQHTEEDAELLTLAVEGIADLNLRYPESPFLLFQRERTWSESEQRWIGRERKRGKIEDLNALLCGAGDPSILRIGELPSSVRFVITLDADTQLPAGAARKMIETISHPLNRVEYDAVTQVRKRGFAIIQPRVSISLPGATATRFTRIFSDATGTDPYCQAVSDAQQDLFGEAMFHGKAIYDVAAFHAILAGQFPPETLLSHDLIEGAFVGVGLASGIELFENLPTDYWSFSKRQHRWIRGDWQISPWIFARVPSTDGTLKKNPLSAGNRWRILDNLRRSLVPVASLLLLISGWLESVAPGVWSLVVAVALFVPALAPLLDRAVRRVQGTAHGWRGAADELIRAVVLISLLPHQAWISIDAIGRVLYRRWVSHRNLLEWQTAEGVQHHAEHHTNATLLQLLIVSACSLAMFVALIIRGEFAPTFFFVALWIASPAMAIWMARPRRQSALRRITAADKRFLRSMARLTWRYFDDFVGLDSNWLPPDNSQTALRVEIAQRTSPTNIGLWLATAAAARDFGYLTVDAFENRCAETLKTLQKLERYEGHFLNWYDTRTLQPLLPRYVSTVDSGNLLASLWVLAQAGTDAMRVPLLSAQCLRGLADTLRILSESSGRDPSFAVPVRALRRLLRRSTSGAEIIGRLRLAHQAVEQLTQRYRWQVADKEQRSYWVERLRHDLGMWLESVERYLLWMETLAHPPDQFVEQLGREAVAERSQLLLVTPTLKDLAGEMPQRLRAFLDQPDDNQLHIRAWLDQIAAEWEAAHQHAADLARRLDALSKSASQFADGIRMGVLYDKQRRLFGIGYLVGGPIEFTSHYDLLASECRLASFTAIAKGDVPLEHWFALGRLHPLSSGGRALLSWSGTMFEYLMPLLFMPDYPNSMLDSACDYAVERQVEYGRERGVPWGISESAYSAIDANQTYQYRAFGVPGLGLQTGLEKDLVVAPYATMLALQVAPVAAIANLRRLVATGMLGSFGFYESIDYTRQSSREGGRGVIVYAYMAHHQAMSLLSLDNVLHGNAMQRRYDRDPRVRANEAYLSIVLLS
ncbi:MAG: glucoamylase family protein, partial [Bryobacteraceae bacterium]